MEDTLDDFIQKYRNSFVFIKTKQGDILTEFIEADKVLTFSTPDIGKIHVTFENAKSIVKCIFPETGLYNIGDYTFAHLFRKPERQFKRSPCKSNTRIRSIALNQELDVNFTALSEAFSPSYPKNKAEAKKLIDIRGGVALSNKFGLVMSDVADFDLFYMDELIGDVTNDKINIEYKPLIQEARDFFGENLTWN